ncbi:hypothetical protein HCAG_02883 [Histoplasma mississippiense (nom. inval.)]|uniref:hypothetical protein n=1 Tax=Ajellomyces capsulatus (strain NAm1 / WU24) TaxID=2059318 RepID=UPI000157BD75|nr:hypothetical protein HCAG_02883 [Histoplasma mississippiense (nom. inval.)]EDN06280.1 hypothetical protein HCAG_02883 [Histoplasma mississippiense (nom. inval.)]
MVFTPPKWVSPLPNPPDNIPLSEFMLNEKYGRHPLEDSYDPFVCALSGKSYSTVEVAKRVDVLARSLCKELGWHPNEGSEFSRVACIYSVNTIDYLTLCWAIHHCSGVVSAASASYTAPELTHQLKDSGSKSIFACAVNLQIALEAAATAGIPRSRIYLFDLPPQLPCGGKAPDGFKTVEQLIIEGSSLPQLEKLNWQPGQAAKQAAFLCYSSGTSGPPKGVMVTHRNVIAHVLQMKEFEARVRNSLKAPGSRSDYKDVVLGLLPQSHVYSLAVPPIIILMLQNKVQCDKRDLNCVSSICTGAAPLGAETIADVKQWRPSWVVRQGYAISNSDDIFPGSCGTLLPDVEVRLVSPDGEEVTGYDQPGELVVRSPSVTLGYLNNEKATKETFRDGWIYTGDVGLFRVSPLGNEHVFIVDRVKELIKVKGYQVAPAEMESHLLSHPAVADCCVISVPDRVAGELPKAFVVKSPSAGNDDAAIIKSIQKYVEDHKARYKWLKGGVEFIEAIPKSPSGKIMRRVLRDREKESRRKAGLKL